MRGPTDPDNVLGVLFDLDGTLYEPPTLFKPLVTLSMPLGIPYLRRLSAARDAVSDVIFPSRDSLMDAFYSKLAELSGRKQERVMDWYLRRFLPGFIEALRRRCSPRGGLLPLLTDLRSRGIMLAVVSDFGLVSERLAALEIPSAAFDHVASAEDSGALKPSPKGFLDAARFLGLSADQLLIVGDRDDKDGAAARAAGMPFLHLATRSESPPPGSVAWPEARTWLRSLGAG